MSIIVSVNPKVFAKGVSAAKSLGGTFDGASKTWRLHEVKVNAARTGQEATPLAEWLGYRGLILTGAQPAREQHSGACAAIYGGACECRQ